MTYVSAGFRIRVVGALCLLCCACGGNSSDTLPKSIDFALIDSEHRYRDLSEMRGEPLIVWIFSPFDELSSLMSGEIEKVTTTANTIAVLVQPNARRMIGPFAQSAVGFPPLFYFPGDKIPESLRFDESPTLVPTTLVLDAHGNVLERKIGFVSADDLLKAYRSARDRGVFENKPRHLLGKPTRR